VLILNLSPGGQSPPLQRLANSNKKKEGRKGRENLKKVLLAKAKRGMLAQSIVALEPPHNGGGRNQDEKGDKKTGTRGAIKK